MELTFPWAPVKALAHLASKQDIRKWCMGVWLDTSAPTLRVMATDGLVLGLYETDEPSTDAPPVFLPLHIVEAAKDFHHSATVRIDDTGHAHVECFGTRHYWKDEKHALVEYRRVFPASCTGIAQQFDAELLARFVKVRKALGQKPAPSAVRISHNGKDSTASGPDGALVTLMGVPEFAGVLSCLRQGESADPFGLVPKSTPEWVFVRGAAQAPAPAEEACDLV